MPDLPTLWIVSELYYPEMTSTGYYITTITEGLAREGRVRVICGQPNYSSKGILAPRSEVRNGVEIFRVASTRLNKNLIRNRVVNMATLAASTFWRGLRSFRAGDRTLVVTTPPVLPFSVAAAALLKGSAYTLLIHDAYPEQLIAVGALRPNSVPVRIIRFLNRWLYKHAAKIIVVGRDMKELIERNSTGLDIPIVNIPNWAETQLVRPQDRAANPLLADLGLLDKFVVLSAGNLGRPTDVATIADCAELMLGDTDVHFVFVGDGAKLPWLKEQVAKRGLTNVTLVGPLPREEQSIFLNACDVALITFVDGMLGAAVPSRMYNLLAAGKPIVAVVDDESEVSRVIREENVGRCAPGHDPAMLRTAILGLKARPDELEDMRHRARSAAESRYSPATAVAAYKEALT
jgi:glycosyltransferase involved in cell wall biosynthesis